MPRVGPHLLSVAQHDIRPVHFFVVLVRGLLRSRAEAKHLVGVASERGAVVRLLDLILRCSPPHVTEPERLIMIFAAHALSRGPALRLLSTLSSRGSTTLSGAGAARALGINVLEPCAQPQQPVV